MNSTIKNSAKILVVDDQAGMRTTLKGILTKRGYEVETAEDGEQALLAVEKGDFRLVLMDIKMPGMSGVEAFLRIKQLNPSATVIMMTAFAMEDEIRRALREGAYTVMYKPFKINEMLGLIGECLEDRTLVLVVDDQDEVRESLKMSLEAQGYRVVDSDTGEDCLKKIMQRKYQIILLDIKMPGIDGLQTLHRVKEVRPDVSVIMMSGQSVEATVQKALNEGSCAYVAKPIKIENLLEVIDKSLGDKKS